MNKHNTCVHDSGSPRPSPHSSLHVNITTALDQDAVFRFIAQAYPVPLPTDVIWERCNSTCHTLQSGPGVNISTYGLETILTIIRVTTTDFGVYRLNIRNDAGTLIQDYTLTAQGILHLLFKLFLFFYCYGFLFFVLTLYICSY